MDEDKRISDLVDMLDQLVSDGSAHINVDGSMFESGEDAQVSTSVSIDCGTHNMACCVPTLHKGIDDN
ncbi:MAG: hypothetical protein IJZ72_04410 [Oscillospiraceae bacterium]|nr:hypothetical protein [Oscillospiraceae bacterium]